MVGNVKEYQHMERKLHSETIYDGRVLKLIRDDVELDDGTKSMREVVIHHGGACIALKNKHNKFYMVRQYRYSLSMEMLEFCAGKLNEGENPTEAIIREAQEELGVTVKNLKSYGYVVPTCGYSSEKIYLFYGEEDEQVGQHFDEDERLEVEEYSFEELLKMIETGELVDGKTICLLQRMMMEMR